MTHPGKLMMQIMSLDSGITDKNILRRCGHFCVLLLGNGICVLAGICTRRATPGVSWSNHSEGSVPGAGELESGPALAVDGWIGFGDPHSLFDTSPKPITLFIYDFHVVVVKSVISFTQMQKDGRL